MSSTLVSNALCQVLNKWNVPVAGDGHRIPALVTTAQLGACVAAKALKHLIVPSSMTHQVLLIQPPHSFPTRHRLRCTPVVVAEPRDLAPTPAAIQCRLDEIRSWAPILSQEWVRMDDDSHEEKRLELFILWLEALLHSKQNSVDLTSRGRGRNGNVYTSSAILRSLLFSAELSNASRMRKALDSAISVCASDLEAAWFRQQLQTARIPGKNCLSKFRLFMDVAHMLRMGEAETQSATTSVRFIMTDSSPQHGYELLMTHVVSIGLADIEQASKAMDALIKLHVLKANDLLSEEDAQDILLYSSSLEQSINIHTLPPVAMGCGANQTDTPKKLSALMHQIWLECSSMHSFKRFLSSIRCFTTDLGTESHLADAPRISLHQLLPRYCDDQEVVIEDDVGGIDDDAGGTMQFENSAIFPGVLHIIGNLAKDLCFSLEFFEHWYEHLHATTLLLHRRVYCERLRALYFNVEPMKSRYAWMFETRCANVAEWRWSTLVTVLIFVLPRLFPLRLVWKQSDFLEVFL